MSLYHHCCLLCVEKMVSLQFIVILENQIFHGELPGELASRYSCSPPPKSVLSCYIKLSCTSLQLAPPHHLATTWLHCEHTLILFITMCLPPSTACWLWEFYSLWLPENPGPDRGTQESWIITGGGFQLKNNVHNIICCGIPSWVSWEGAMIPSHRNSKTSTIILLVCCSLKAI